MTNAVNPREVQCPACGGKSLYSSENRWRPFCSERCRRVDLGAWATERYRVAAKPDPNDDLLDDLPPAAPGH